MRVLRLALTVLFVLALLPATARAESSPPPATETPTDPPPTLPQGDDPKGGGGLG